MPTLKNWGMMMIRKLMGALTLSASIAATAANAASDQMASGDGMNTGDAKAEMASGDGKGSMAMDMPRLMFSYRYMHMDMAGNRIGTNDVSPAFIATTIPNRFFGMPGQPPTLRIVPTSMTMDMHMFSTMYMASPKFQVMAMLPYIEKSMDHLTFAGPVGTAVLGRFNTKSSGIGDIKVIGRYSLLNQGPGKLRLDLGISLPTGSITETGTVLTPMGATPTVRLPYSMQLGSGTFDLLPGLSYSLSSGAFEWGGDANGVIRLGSNDEGYSLGDEAAASLWARYKTGPSVTLSGRIEAKTVGRIDGIDPLIMGPNQTADPLNYGGETITIFAGAEFASQKSAFKGHIFSIQAGVPIFQDLNGPQVETDWIVSAGWQKAF
jgi:hypothetical protein